jgi:hypothetical protein
VKSDRVLVSETVPLRPTAPNSEETRFSSDKLLESLGKTTFLTGIARVRQMPTNFSGSSNSGFKENKLCQSWRGLCWV